MGLREGIEEKEEENGSKSRKPAWASAKTSDNLHSYTLLGRPIIIFRKFRKTRP